MVIDENATGLLFDFAVHTPYNGDGMKTDRLEIRIAEEDKREWTKASIRARLSLSSWVKMLVTHAMQEPLIWQQKLDSGTKQNDMSSQTT